jgi:uncharacterized damage-inducible protein DinB
MKEYFLNLANYQKWANDRFREHLKKNPESLSIDTPYGPVKNIATHIFGAVELWLKRVEGISPSTIKSGEEYSNWEELCKDWVATDDKLIAWLKTLDETDMVKKIKYTSLEKKNLETSLEHILTQLVTHHQSYHRGQIGMAIREKKLPPVQETDYIYYFYDKIKN